MDDKIANKLIYEFQNLMHIFLLLFLFLKFHRSFACETSFVDSLNGKHAEYVLASNPNLYIIIRWKIDQSHIQFYGVPNIRKKCQQRFACLYFDGVMSLMSEWRQFSFEFSNDLKEN